MADDFRETVPGAPPFRPTVTQSSAWARGQSGFNTRRVGERRLRATCLLGLVFLALAATGTAQADDLSQANNLSTELKIGALAHDVNPRYVDGEPSLFGNHVEPASLDINFEALFPPVRPLFGGTLRPAVGVTLNTAGGTSQAYADMRWQYEWPSDIFFALGVGAAVHDGNLGPDDSDHRALGTRVLFHIPVELGVRVDEHSSISLFWDHASNAGLNEENPGLDRLGIRYGYRF
jgi:lipid A 3-O-deacylase